MSNSNGDRGIEMAVDKESLVICQTFKSGNTQLVTFVGKEELQRLRAAVDEALGNSGEPAPRLPSGSLGIGQARLRQGMVEGSIRVEGNISAGDISGGDILDPTPSKNGEPPEKGAVRREEWATPIYEQPEGCVLRNQRLYEVTEEGRIGIHGWIKYHNGGES